MQECDFDALRCPEADGFSRLLDAEAAADVLAWANSGFSIDASVRVAMVDRDVPSYFRSLEHLLRYCARPAFALDRLSLLPGGEFLDRLADLVPPPRKHRHRYHGVFAPNHPLRPAVTALAIGNASSLPRPPGEGRGEGAPDAPGRSHDTSRIAWAKLMAKIAEDFPLARPACGGDIRLIAFIIRPGPQPDSFSGTGGRRRFGDNDCGSAESEQPLKSLGR